MSQKPDDWNTISLCRMHHSQQHNVGERSFEKLYGIDMASLADELAKASPKAMEIRQAKKERDGG